MKSNDNAEKLRKLSISELDTIRKILINISDRGHLDQSEKGIYQERIATIEELIKTKINNLF